MSISTFSSLLEEWEKSAEKQAGKVPTTVSIYECDEIKLRALAKVYGLPLEEVTASLIHQALLELEEKMPYVAGDKVIRVEEGANIYEDVGPMSRYLKAQKELKGSGLNGSS